ncbi:MAG: hypothetical protein ACK5PF_11555, partial [bacterium]
VLRGQQDAVALLHLSGEILPVAAAFAHLRAGDAALDGWRSGWQRAWVGLWRLVVVGGLVGHLAALRLGGGGLRPGDGAVMHGRVAGAADAAPGHLGDVERLLDAAGQAQGDEGAQRAAGVDLDAVDHGAELLERSDGELGHAELVGGGHDSAPSGV